MLLRTLVALVALGLVAGCSVKPTPGGSGVGSGAPITVYALADRQPAPVLRGELLDGGGAFDLADHAGEVVVVNFWAHWCAPCVIEADDLEGTYQATKSSRVTFLGINTRDERDAAKRFLVGRSTYPSVFDPAGKVALGFSVPPTAIPSTIIVDRRGRVAAVTFGAVLRGDFEPVVSQLAAESP